MWRRLLLAATVLTVSRADKWKTEKQILELDCPAVCEKDKCPNIGPIKLSDCPQPYIKTDQCGCCQRCDIVHMTTTISPLKRDEVCEKVICPKKRLCMLNIQGLPVCKCPTLDLCVTVTGRKKNKVCGSDGVTYPSRCHVKVASCQADKKIRAVSKGECAVVKPNSSEVLSTALDDAELEIDVIIEKPKHSAGRKFSQEILGLGEEVTELLSRQIDEESRRERRKERKRERKRQNGRRKPNRKKKNKQNKQEKKLRKARSSVL